MLLLQKTLLGVEGITRNLDPEIDMWEAARPAVETFMAERLRIKSIIREFREEMPGWVARLPEMPKSVFDIVDKVRSGKLNVLTQDPSVALLREELHLMLSRIVYALAGIGLLVLSLVIYLWIRWDEDLTFSFHLTIALFAGLGGGMILSSIFNRRKK